MAGIDKPVHPVDKEAIKKGGELAAQADGLLLLFDTSQKERAEDFKLINKYKNKKVIFLFNKIDLPQKMDKNRIKIRGKKHLFLEISALKATNLGKLKEMIHEFFVPKEKKGEAVILHLRQKLLLEDILNCLLEGDHLLKEGYPEEIYAEEIRKTIPLIGQLTGEIRVEEIIEDIFKRFCVGK